MLRELKKLYEIVDHNDFEKLVNRWKENFLKFYAIIYHDFQYDWEVVYRTCLFLEAMYGSELAKSVLFYDDTRLEMKIREENAVLALLSEVAEYHVISKKMKKDELLNEIDECLKSLKKIKEEEEQND
jgi:hypothetical protein